MQAGGLHVSKFRLWSMPASAPKVRLVAADLWKPVIAVGLIFLPCFSPLPVHRALRKVIGLRNFRWQQPIKVKWELEHWHLALAARERTNNATRATAMRQKSEKLTWCASSVCRKRRGTTFTVRRFRTPRVSGEGQVCDGLPTWASPLSALLAPGRAFVGARGEWKLLFD